MAAGMTKRAVALLVLMLSTLGAGSAFALDDPTRPAFELVPGLDGRSVDTRSVSTPSGLQSVILAGKREAAIINGVEVEVGEKYGDARLAVVNETCVVLIGPAGRKVMHMYPTVNLSKTEKACEGRRGLPTITKAKVRKKPRKKAAKAKKKVVTCVDDVSKDGDRK